MRLRGGGLAVVTALLCLALAGSMSAATTITTVVQTPISGVIATSCSVSENLAFSGTYRSVFHYTLDGQGAAHFSGSTQTNGVATGLVTGTPYRFMGASSSTTFEAPGSLPYHNTFTNTFLLVSRGPQDNLLMRVTLHVTVTPDGVMTADVSEIRFECVG
jgi:hypothetical protein